MEEIGKHTALVGSNSDVADQKTFQQMNAEWIEGHRAELLGLRLTAESLAGLANAQNLQHLKIEMYDVVNGESILSGNAPPFSLQSPPQIIRDYYAAAQGWETLLQQTQRG